MKKKLIFAVIFVTLVASLLSAENGLAETIYDDTVSIPSGYYVELIFDIDRDNTDVTIAIDVESGPSVRVILEPHISSTVSSKSFSVTLDAGSHTLFIENWGASTSRVSIKITTGFAYWGAVIVIVIIIAVVLILRSKSKKQKKLEYAPSSYSSTTRNINGSTGSTRSASETSYYPSRQPSQPSSQLGQSSQLSQPGQPSSQISTESSERAAYCYNCGHKVFASAKFCDSCGTKQ